MRVKEQNNRVVVYTSGTFDLFHHNHLKMIKYARGLGDVLIVGVNTDKLVRKFKKPPVIPFEQRIEIVEALSAPDVVIPQHSMDHRDKVDALSMDVFVVGDDWKGKFDYLKDMGVEVYYFPYGEGVSTTKLRLKIS